MTEGYSYTVVRDKDQWRIMVTDENGETFPSVYAKRKPRLGLTCGTCKWMTTRSMSSTVPRANIKAKGRTETWAL